MLDQTGINDMIKSKIQKRLGDLILLVILLMLFSEKIISVNALN